MRSSVVEHERGMATRASVIAHSRFSRAVCAGLAGVDERLFTSRVDLEVSSLPMEVAAKITSGAALK